MTKQDLITLSLFTSQLFCPFPEYHRAMEELMGRPIMVHEMGNAEFMRSVREAAKPAALALVYRAWPELDVEG